MAKTKVSSVEIIEPESMQASTAEEYSQRGWLFYGKQDYTHAEEDFRQSLSLSPDMADTLFALGLVMKAVGKNDEAIACFEKVLGLIPTMDDKTRASILKRLVSGHLNVLRKGDWDLEKEIWQAKR
ncbi:MAG TPA: tetratricopeptide repeat protein [Anaerolineaceae bacterium]